MGSKVEQTVKIGVVLVVVSEQEFRLQDLLFVAGGADETCLGRKHFGRFLHERHFHLRIRPLERAYCVRFE